MTHAFFATARAFCSAFDGGTIKSNASPIMAGGSSMFAVDARSRISAASVGSALSSFSSARSSRASCWPFSEKCRSSYAAILAAMCASSRCRVHFSIESSSWYSSSTSTFQAQFAAELELGGQVNVEVHVVECCLQFSPLVGVAGGEADSQLREFVATLLGMMRPIS